MRAASMKMFLLVAVLAILSAGEVAQARRHYLPGHGRWLQRDPAGYVDGMNLYSYVTESPVAWSDGLGLHRDFNPSGPRAKTIPPNGARWDGSQWWANEYHMRLYDFYTRLWGYKWPDGSTADYLILGGSFLHDVRGQSGQLALNEDVDLRLRSDAQVMLDQMGCGQRDTFVDRGARGITADMLSTNVRLSLQRYTVYWEAECSIGPRRCRIPTERCASGCRSQAFYSCSVSWTLYDYYDFCWWEPYGWAGTPFHIFGFWSSTESNTARICDAG